MSVNLSGGLQYLLDYSGFFISHLYKGMTNYRNGPQRATTDRNGGRLGHNGPPGTAKDGVSCGNRNGDRLKRERLS